MSIGQNTSGQLDERSTSAATSKGWWKFILPLVLMLAVAGTLLVANNASAGVPTSQQNLNSVTSQAKNATNGNSAADKAGSPSNFPNPAAGSNQPDALGDTLFTIDVAAATTPSDDIALGVQYAQGFYWVTGRNSGDNIKRLWKLTTAGVQVAVYTQDNCGSSTFGWRDLAFDGTNLWAADECGVDEIDPATGTRIGGFANPGGQLARSMAYDPATSHFYSANFDSPIIVFDNTGAVVTTLPANGLANYGFAWDAVSPGGPFLWTWSQDGPTLLHAAQLNPATGAPTGVSFDGQTIATTDIAGGADITDQLGNGTLTLVAMHQSDANAIRGYDLAVPIGGATNTPTNTPIATTTPCAVTNPINEGFEGGLNTFSSVVGTCVPGGCGWTSTGNPHSGSNSAFAPDLADVSDQYLELTNPISIPAGSTSATLTFWHAYDMENTYDGGVLEVSTDGGSTWADVTAVGGSFISGGYDGAISTAFNSPIAGRQAWTGAFTSYRLVSVNLNSLIGQSNLKIRFREANDESLAHVGWNVDDVLLSVAGSCGSVTATPTGATATAVATCVPGQLVVGPNAPASGNIPFKHTNTDTKLAATGSGAHGGTATLNLPFAPITFLLDDGTYENSVGWTDQSTNTEYGSIWLNRFTPPAGSYPIALNTVSIEWPDSSSGTLVGKQVRVLVYSDADGDGDPSNATLLDNQVVTVASLNSFLDYTVNATITSGDIYAGFEDLWADPGYTPPLYPAAIDTDSSNLRSYVAANDDNSAPDYTNLGNNQEIGTIEALSGGTITGNWLIRTSGDTNVASCVTSTPVPPTDTVVSTDTPVATDTPAATATCVPGFLVVGPSAPAAANVSFKHTSGKISATGSGAHGGTATVNLPFAPITFLLDDGTYESGIGWNDMSTESAAIWINKFTPPAGSYPITLNTVSIEWPQNSAGTLVGLQARILVYSDADGDGDPSNATLLSSSLVTIASLNSFLDYTVNATITSGDIYVGFEDQWAENGYTPLLYPAAIDTDSTNNRSYVAAMGDGSAPDYTNLGNNDNIGTIDDLSGGAITGNWLIRTSGDTNVVPCATGTATVVPPTDTAVVTGTPPTETPTAGSPTETPTACTLSFEDVPPGTHSTPTSSVLPAEASSTATHAVDQVNLQRQQRPLLPPGQQRH